MPQHTEKIYNEMLADQLQLTIKTQEFESNKHG